MTYNYNVGETVQLVFHQMILATPGCDVDILIKHIANMKCHVKKIKGGGYSTSMSISYIDIVTLD